MPTHGYRYRSSHMVLIGVGAVPFVIWEFRSRGMWPEFSVSAYLLTAFLILTLINGYPGPGSRWYWKPVAIMTTVHFALLSVFLSGALAIVARGMKPPAAMFFSVVIAVLALESWAALRVIAMFLT
jgi:hypothetical protein